ncbi:MAG: hypothetical protein JXR91_04725 [Deltaproteobacteria bacterium]|nr:hypothetical protein [Deltaproteobacteria bacterium]
MSSMVRNFLAGLSSREKVMVSAMAVTAVLMIAGLTAFFVGGAANDNLDNATEWTDLLKTVKIMGPDYKSTSAPQDSARVNSKPKPLRTLVDKVISQIEIDEPDTKELNDKSYPSGWLEKSVEVSFRSIELESIIKFMEAVEKNRTSFNIAVTDIDIKKNRREEDKYIVRMTIATYEKIAVTDSKSRTTREASR